MPGKVCMEVSERTVKIQTARRRKETKANLCPERVYQAIVEDLDEPVRIMDRELHVLLANHAARECQDIPGKSLGGIQCDEVFPGNDRHCIDCLVRSTFKDGQPHRREVSGIDVNGDRWVSEIQTKPLLGDKGEVFQVIETFRDRSQVKRLERQLLQSAKLVSIGEVATGIAHEIRNPLAGIRLGLDALEPNSIQDPSAKDILNDISRDITRLDRVVSDLLNFTKSRPSEPEWFHLDALFNQVCRYIRGSASQQGIAIEMEVQPSDLRLWADRNQIHQVLLNLLLNSVQAMPKGGKLSLRGKWGDNLNWSGERKERSGSRITVRDTGCGINEETMERLFDPFFTTKPNGTGLGLATSLSIIRKHNGEIRINSTPGEGTTAQILLPEGPENT